MAAAFVIHTTAKYTPLTGQQAPDAGFTWVHLGLCTMTAVFQDPHGSKSHVPESRYLPRRFPHLNLRIKDILRMKQALHEALSTGKSSVW